MNILKNPTLQWDGKTRYVQENKDDMIAIEQPVDWRYVSTPRYPHDINRIPESIHHESGAGFKLSAGWRKWKAGYNQAVMLQRGQRYVAKATFVPHVAFTGAVGDDWRTHIEWAFSVYTNGGNLERAQPVASTSNERFGLDEECLYVIEARQDIKVDLTFWAECRWESNAANFHITGIYLEEVGQDYGEPVYIGDVEPEPSPTPPPPPITGGVADLLASYITQEIDLLEKQIQLKQTLLDALKALSQEA